MTDLNELERLLKEATQGPLQVKRRASYEEPGNVILWPDRSKGGLHMRRLDCDGNFTEQDANLIVAAINALPGLIDRVRELEKKD